MVDAGALRAISTVLEVLVLLMLIIAVIMAKTRKDIKAHWKILAIATMLNAFAVLLLMLPRFLTLVDNYSIAEMDLRAWTVIVHHTLGLMGLIMSLYLIAYFIDGGGSMERCPTRSKKDKNIMRLTFVSMSIPLVIGLILRFYRF